MAVEGRSEGEVSSCDSDSMTSSVYRNQVEVSNEMVGVVDHVVDERRVGMELTLCTIKVIEGEDVVYEAVNEELVIEAGWRLRGLLMCQRDMKSLN
ncbi:hypothetical protein V6N11_033234 [Hibiscus sabdariffa]|uniref:Uncharacterized protein n=1 Tax=Hibiscus sabdariffa TaxID=183260 RepID=A0ABR2PXH0_9ROSI